MRTRIDDAGHVVVPKGMRDELGLVADSEVEIELVDHRIVITPLSRAEVEEGPHGLRLLAPRGEALLTTAAVRDLMEKGRR